MRGATSVLTAVALIALPGAVQGQARLSRAMDLERSGRYADAAALFRETLREQPANLPALLGLERVSDRIDQQDSVLHYTLAALEAAPGNRFVRSVELRAWASLGRIDSLAAAAGRWVEAEPESPDPYREWAFAMSQRGDLIEAQRILTLGRDRLGDDVLARELAQIWIVTDEWTRAAEYWASAVRSDPGQTDAAATSLARANPAIRDRVANILTSDDRNDPARIVAAHLLASWNRPEEGWVVLSGALPDDSNAALAALRPFVDRVRRLRGTAAARARGFALERIAELTGGSYAENARLEAARAFAEAGNRDKAERLLGEIAVDSTVVSPSQAGAMASLIGVIAESGRVAQAEERFEDWADRLLLSDVAALRVKIAWAWVMQDSLDRAERIVAPDSSIEVLAARGWIALFHGDAVGALEMFRRAGPLAGSRAESTRRTEVMALLQLVDRDTLPELGEAMLTLYRGDTLAAVTELESAATLLTSNGGRADLLALGGRLAFEGGDLANGERLLQTAVALAPSGPSAPLSQLTLARTYLATGRREDGIAALENVIIDYPNSAVVPRARRLLDREMGAIPES